MNATQCQREFHQLATRAVSAGLLTRRDVAVIARAGTRKASYWCAHLERLRAVLRERGR